MIPNITVQQLRGNTQLQQALQVRLERMSPMEAAYYGGAAPYFRFTVYILDTYDIRQADLLVDLVNLDPTTGNKETYRVIDNPGDDQWSDAHMEIAVERVVGTGIG